MSIHENILKFHTLFKGATKTGFNPHFKSEYYTLDDLLAATKDPLAKAGLCIFHLSDVDENGNFLLSTIVANADDERIKTTIPVPQGSNPQVLGSWLTYAKKYNIMNILATGGELEDDGNIAAANQPQTITPETEAQLRDYIEATDLDEKQAEFFKAHPVEGMTEPQAKAVLARLKAK